MGKLLLRLCSGRACSIAQVVLLPIGSSNCYLIPFTIRNLPLTFMDHSSEAEEISMTMAHLNQKLVLPEHLGFNVIVFRSW